MKDRLGASFTSGLPHPMKHNVDYMLPLYGREQLDKVKAIRSITGDYIGISGSSLSFISRISLIPRRK